jgi:hypothetical protein
MGACKTMKNYPQKYPLLPGSAHYPLLPFSISTGYFSAGTPLLKISPQRHRVSRGSAEPAKEPWHGSKAAGWAVRSARLTPGL